MPFKKNVFLLGAGASADAGAPLMWNFLQAAWSLMRDPNSNLESDERTTFESVFTYQFNLRKAQAFVDVDLDNVEDLFGVIDLDERVGRVGAQDARQSLVYLIVRTLELTIRPKRVSEVRFLDRPKDENKNAWDRFAEIAARLPFKEQVQSAWLKGSTNAIITLNYDLLVDSALTRAAVPPDYALPDAVDNRTRRSSGKSIRLLKLHGSAGWAHCPRCDDDCVYVFDDFESARLKPCEKKNHAPMSPLIVPPTWDKGASRSHLAPVWKAAWEELRTAQRLFIIGYSAPPSDRHFRYFLASALANNNDLGEIVVVTKAEQRADAEKTYRKLFTGAAAEHRLAFPETAGFQGYIAEGKLFSAVGGPG